MQKERLYSPGENIGPYRVERVLALGSAAAIYEATPHPQLRADLRARGIHRVALKMPRVELLPQDRQEHRRMVERLRLHEVGIPSFIVHGNHAPLTPEAGALGLPPSVTVFGPAWSEVPVMREGRVLCRVQGISYEGANMPQLDGVEATATAEISKMLLRWGR